jgi:hypothetical protein
MRKHPFSDDDIEALLRGDTPQRRPELASVADAVAEMRIASSGTPPQPNAALAALLDHGLVAQGLSAEKGDLPVTAASNASGPARQVFRLPKWRNRMIIEWIAGMGLAAKLGLGATMAAASVATAGVGGVLPGPTQGAFETVVNTTTPFTVGETGTPDTPAPTPSDVPTPAPSDAVVDAEEKAREEAEDAEEQAREDALDAEEQAREDAEDAEEQAREDAEDAAGKAHDADEQAREDAEEAEEQARQRDEHARETQRANEERARETQRDDEDRARESQRAGEDRARDNARDGGSDDD